MPEHGGYEQQFQKRDWIEIISNSGMNGIAHAVRSWRVEKGFVTPHEPNSEMLGKLMLVVTEVAEAAEACRDSDWDNFEEEIADTFIRLLDIVGTVGIDIEVAIALKMIKNEGRPHKHGRESAV